MLPRLFFYNNDYGYIAIYYYYPSEHPLRFAHSVWMQNQSQLSKKHMGEVHL
jgi:hypothetical protein